ncbi:hypothetical protein FHR76_002200 [Rhizobium sp. RAS22]|nr:hypothetical protein [Rhizobium sp. RAS22]
MTQKTNNAVVVTLDLAVKAKSLETATSKLHGHIAATQMTSKEIMIAVSLVMKAISGSKEVLKEFRDLAHARKVSVPKDFDPSQPKNGSNNPALIVVRVLVGEFDANGVWVPSIYAAKNFPGVVRWLNKAVETSAEGLASVLENAKAKVGAKKTVSGIEAAKRLDRDEHGEKRDGKTTKTYIPFGVSRLRPIATFKADPKLFPVNDQGFGVGTIRLLGDGTYGIFFGSADGTDVETTWALGFEAHEETLAKMPAPKTVAVKGKSTNGAIAA